MNRPRYAVSLASSTKKLFPSVIYSFSWNCSIVIFRAHPSKYAFFVAIDVPFDFPLLFYPFLKAFFATFSLYQPFFHNGQRIDQMEIVIKRTYVLSFFKIYSVFSVRVAIFLFFLEVIIQFLTSKVQEQAIFLHRYKAIQIVLGANRFYFFQCKLLCQCYWWYRKSRRSIVQRVFAST